MKLYEYEAKEILRSHGFPTPTGRMVTTPDEVAKAAEEIRGPAAVKSQILVAGRGKAGGIKFAVSPNEVKQVATDLLGSTIKGIKVRKLLVEEKLKIAKEAYVGITVDRSQRCYVVLASSVGGVDIEEVARKTPEKIIRYNIDPIQGLMPYKASALAGRMGYEGAKRKEVASALNTLYRIAVDCDAELAEMNPLVETEDGRIIAADARIIIDDNALFRQGKFKERLLESEGELSQREIEAKKHDVAYVDLDGDIGIIGNGAGLVMATLDLVAMYGGKPANFLDVGGGASADVVYRGLKIVLSKPEVRKIVANILGGITHCDEVARGILQVLNETKDTRPLFIRLVGTREDEARKILSEAGIRVLDSMEEVIDAAVKNK